LDGLVGRERVRRRRRARRRGAWPPVVAAVAALLVCGACVGTVSRDEFQRVIQERGGGFTSDLPLDAVAAVTGELGVPDVELRQMTVTASTETVVLEVRDPADPANLDTYVVRGGSIDSVEPVRLSAGDDLDRSTYPASSLALDRLDGMVDGALAEFGEPDGYVASLTVLQLGEGDVVLQLGLESSRATAYARFTAGGELIEVTRS
jgi:hypothetical protein